MQYCFCQSEFTFMSVIPTRSNFPGSDSPDQTLGKKIRFFYQFLVDNTFFHNATVSFTLQWLFLLSLIFLINFCSFGTYEHDGIFQSVFLLILLRAVLAFFNLTFLMVFSVFMYFLEQKSLVGQKPCMVESNDRVKMVALYLT